MKPAPWFVAAALAAGPGSSTAAFAEELTEEAASSAPAPAESYPPPPPTGVFRAFSLTVAVGPGALIGPGEQTLGVSHNLVRLGWGVARNLSSFVSFEGAHAPSVNPRTHQRSWLRHDTVSVGMQLHFRRRAYVRGSLGFGFVGEETRTHSFSGGSGVAMTGALGWELVQLARHAVAVELAGNITRYPTEFWGTTGLNLTVSFF
jgi:hypothetical protein